MTNDAMELQTNKADGNQLKNREWCGYTLEELRYERALALIKLENKKATLMQMFKPRERNNAKSSTNFVTNLLHRISAKMTIVDYVIIGFNLSKMLLKFKRKRR